MRNEKYRRCAVREYTLYSIRIYTRMVKIDYVSVTLGIYITCIAVMIGITPKQSASLCVKVGAVTQSY